VSSVVIETAIAVIAGAVLVFVMVAYGRYSSSRRLESIQNTPERKTSVFSGTGTGSGTGRTGSGRKSSARVFRCGGTIDGRLYTGVMVTVRVFDDTLAIEYLGGRLEISTDSISALSVRRKVLGASLVLEYTVPGEQAPEVGPKDFRETKKTVVLDSAYAERIRDAIGFPRG
jgi:hypothetical protein